MNATRNSHLKKRESTYGEGDNNNTNTIPPSIGIDGTVGIGIPSSAVRPPSPPRRHSGVLLVGAAVVGAAPFSVRRAAGRPAPGFGAASAVFCFPRKNAPSSIETVAPPPLPFRAGEFRAVVRSDRTAASTRAAKGGGHREAETAAKLATRFEVRRGIGMRRGALRFGQGQSLGCMQLFARRRRADGEGRRNEIFGAPRSLKSESNRDRIRDGGRRRQGRYPFDPSPFFGTPSDRFAGGCEFAAATTTCRTGRRFPYATFHVALVTLSSTAARVTW